jgi:PAS domain S-box-containing protein
MKDSINVKLQKKNGCKTIRIIMIHLVWIVFFIIISPCSGNDLKSQLSPEETAWIEEHHTVRVRIGNAPPFMMTDGKLRGISIDYLTHIFNINGIKIQYISDTDVTWPEALEYIKRHEIVDMVPTAKITEERKKDMIFTDEYVFAPWVIFTRVDSDFIGSIDDLNGKTVSVEEGYVMHQKLKQEYPGIKLKIISASLEDYAEIPIRDLSTGLVDAYIGNLLSTTYTIQKKGYANVKVAAPTPFDNHNQAMAIRNDWPELANIINKTLASMTSDEHAAIRNRWLSIRYEYGINKIYVLKWVLGVAGGASLFIGIILFWNKRLKSEVAFRKKIEYDLRESEKKYRLLFESNPYPMWIYSIDTYAFLNVNNAAVKKYGYSKEEFLKMTIKEIRPPEDIERLVKNVENIREGLAESDSWRHLKKDGTMMDVEIISHTMQYDGKRAELVLINDITHRKRAEADRDRLIAAIEQGGETVIITDPKGVIQYVNPTFETVTGYTKEEVLGQTPRILKSGKQDEAFYHQLWSTISEGNCFKGRLINKRKDGTLYTEEVTISPVCDTAGKVINYVAVKSDVTDRIQLEAQLQQAQRMESVGRLAGGVAHDFNNMLTIILNYTQMIMKEVKPSETIYSDLQQILNAGQKSVEITRQLLAFARKQTISPTILNLNKTVEKMLKMLQRLMGEDINLSWLPGPGVTQVLIDPSQIDQILANLCANARDAISGVGKVTIETDNVTIDKDYCIVHSGFVPGNFVSLTVSDNGCGMGKEILGHIFEPFYTTKDLSKGTGLGLATVYGIVKQNNGFINVYSEPGKGTSFKIYLPCYSGEISSFETRVDTKTPRGVGETVLIVEDDVSILKIVKKILDEIGYCVLEAETPTKALDLAQKQSKQIHLLLTDVVMPEMNGRDLAGRLQTLYPELKVLYMSGYTANVIAHQGVLDEGVSFIQKPFSMKDLAIKVQQVLEKKD